ncbi:SDR family oxidoreductase [Candidatus Collierbacteria bacterium]|nr:SDR family oxidoreductase [Candidatus Collierbacteria bacterium]
MNLSGRTAIITGAGDGLGKQVAIKLSRQGVNLALIARDKSRLTEVKQTIQSANKLLKVKIYPCDIRITQDLSNIVKKIIKDFRNVHILINVAGIWQKMMAVEEIDEKVVDDVIDTNLTALIHCTRLVLPILKKQAEAAIINVSSKSGVTAQAGQSVYSASKWGVRGFTEVLKADLKNTPVRVAGVYQSGTNTKMFEKTGEEVPSEKFTDPSDLADVTVYMLSRPEKIWLHEVRVEY